MEIWDQENSNTPRLKTGSTSAQKILDPQRERSKNIPKTEKYKIQKPEAQKPNT